MVGKERNILTAILVTVCRGQSRSGQGSIVHRVVSDWNASPVSQCERTQALTVIIMTLKNDSQHYALESVLVVNPLLSLYIPLLLLSSWLKFGEIWCLV